MLNISDLLRNYINRQILIIARNTVNTIRQKYHSLFHFITMSETQSSQSNDHQSISPNPVFDPSEPSIPISYPIKTLEALEANTYYESFHYPFNRSSVPLQNTELPNRPRLLVCHDMKGGYVDDKWVQGGSNVDSYGIWHWYLIDVFVYFSHDLVTLPPPSWVNAAHRHGVKVLGTFLTEWDEGKVIAEKLLSTEESARMYAERLAKLADALGFDGWLINMEVGVSPGKIPNLKEFVKHLTDLMHARVPGSLIIWYDSVTTDGKLSWQDKLNEKNKLFFDSCDGIFVNYTWKEKDVNYSETVAGDRKYDVYMGIDVFGRGSFGGGQWQTNVALDVIRKADVSAAIFAPGWVYETDQPPDFQTAQNLWWSLVEKSWPISQKYPKVLPFYSNFDQGRGLHISINGKQVLENPWNNISSQSFQPFLVFRDNSTSDKIKASVNLSEASYSGGGNITFAGTLETGDHFIARLFQSELLLKDFPIHIKYSVKSDNCSLLGLLLEFSSATTEPKSILIAPGESNQFQTKFYQLIKPNHVRTQETPPEWTIYDTTITMNGYTLSRINAFCYRPDHTKPTDSAEYFAILGDIRIKKSEHTFSAFPHASSWLVEPQHLKQAKNSQGSNVLSVKLSWKLLHGNVSLYPKYNIFLERKVERDQKYLGSAYAEMFFVSELDVSGEMGSVKFIIQVCSDDGSCQKLEESPFLLLDA